MTRQKTPPDLRPTPRELRWFAHIDRHGPQSSAFLFELTRDTHRCKDTALRRMQALREAWFLREPPQQNAIAKADFHPNVYDLTPQAFEYLSGHRRLERHARPTGHWWHGFWVSSITSAIELAASRSGADYIPASRILALRDVTPGIPTRQGTVVPDQLFALKTCAGFLSYALEVDRGTEPIRSNAARKSLQRSARQYGEVLSHKCYRDHYGLKSNMLILWVFFARKRAQEFLQLAQSETPAVGKSVAATVIDAPFPRFELTCDALRRFETVDGERRDMLGVFPPC